MEIIAKYYAVVPCEEQSVGTRTGGKIISKPWNDFPKERNAAFPGQ